MGVLKLDMEMEPGRPATRYITYYVKPPPGKTTFFSTPATMMILVDALNVPGAESRIRGSKKNKELLPKNIRVTIEWDEVTGQETNSFESLEE